MRLITPSFKIPNLAQIEDEKPLTLSDHCSGDPFFLGVALWLVSLVRILLFSKGLAALSFQVCKQRDKDAELIHSASYRDRGMEVGVFSRGADSIRSMKVAAQASRFVRNEGRSNNSLIVAQTEECCKTVQKGG